MKGSNWIQVLSQPCWPLIIKSLCDKIYCVIIFSVMGSAAPWSINEKGNCDIILEDYIE